MDRQLEMDRNHPFVYYKSTLGISDSQFFSLKTVDDDRKLLYTLAAAVNADTTSVLSSEPNIFSCLLFSSFLLNQAIYSIASLFHKKGVSFLRQNIRYKFTQTIVDERLFYISFYISLLVVCYFSVILSQVQLLYEINMSFFYRKLFGYQTARYRTGYHIIIRKNRGSLSKIMKPKREGLFDLQDNFSSTTQC